ncbi:probable glutamate receptor [Palaemon carinicauda]|uniref:probable glutamate receptor n=1 Tax=Palaemon carinicauda TaxID=392227 RepID=UPI0035B658FB
MTSKRHTAENDSWIEAANQGSLDENPLKFKFPHSPHLRVVAESWPSHVEVIQVDGQLRVRGPMGNFLNELGLSMNFTYSIVQGDGYWGSPQSDGSWNGMIGWVLAKKADFGLGPFGMSPVRNEVIDYTMPLLRENLHALVSRPKPESDAWGFLSPFTWYVWIGLMISSLLVAVVFMISTKQFKAEATAAFFNQLLKVYQLFIGQDVSNIPKSLSHRIMTLAWLLVVLVIMRSYSGSMTSLLAAKTIPIKYDSLRDVLDDTNLQIIMEGSTVLTDHLQAVNTGIYKELSDTMKKRGTFVRAEEMPIFTYKYVPEGNFAVLLESSSCNQIYSDHFQKTGKCDFYKAKEPFWTLIYTLIVPKGSPLRELISSRILALREHGIYNMWALKQTPFLTQCAKMPEKIRATRPYTITDLWAVFLITGCGLMLACIVLACEIVNANL